MPYIKIVCSSSGLILFKFEVGYLFENGPRQVISYVEKESIRK